MPPEIKKKCLFQDMMSSKQQELILDIGSRYHPIMIGIFGSYARGEYDYNSDLDILIEFEQSPNLLELIGLEQELTEELEIKVYLITLQSLNPQLKNMWKKT